MKLTIERTDRLTKFQGRECRVWHGTTATGAPCEIFVACMVGPGDETSRDAFEEELAEVGVRHVPLCQRQAAFRGAN